MNPRAYVYYYDSKLPIPIPIQYTHTHSCYCCLEFAFRFPRWRIRSQKISTLSLKIHIPNIQVQLAASGYESDAGEHVFDHLDDSTPLAGPMQDLFDVPGSILV